MTRNALALILVIAAFGALSGFAIYEHGYLGIFAYHLPSSAGWQVGADLVIACTLAIFWMIGDARRNGRNVWPFVALTLTLGSFGPLFYLLIGELRSTDSAAVYGSLSAHG